MNVKKRISHAILALILMLGSVIYTVPAWAGSTSSVWSPVASLPSGNTLRGVTCGNGIYVAVGSSGTILTSVNGTDNWQSHNSGAADLNGVACGVDSSGGSLFAAVGNGGTILTSSDGTAWNVRSSTTTEAVYGITYGGGQFVAVGSSGTILTSPDGETWEAMTDGSGNPYTGENLYSATYGLDSYGHDILVVAGSNGTILSFLGLSDWSYNSSYSAPSNVGLYGLTFGWDSNGDALFAATGENGTILTSSDGETWSSQVSGVSGTLYGITCGGGQFVAVGDSGTILASDGGAAWAPQTSGTSDGLYSVAWGNSRYVAVGDNGTIVYSDSICAAGAAVITGVSDVGDSGNGSDLEVSFDKVADESLVSEYRIMVAPSDDAGTFNMVKASLASSGNYTGVTPTGSNITVTLSETATDINGDLIENGSTYIVYVLSVADGSNATVNTLSESSAIITLKGVLDRWNWANPKPTGNTLNGSAYANGLYVVVGDQGTILTSSDGNTWTSRTSGATSDLAAVTYGKGRFVAVGSDGCVLTSNDGTVWNEPNTNIPWCYLTGVAYGEGLFVAVTSSNEEVYISPDGKTWTTKTASYFDGIAYSSGQFVAVGGNGRIYTSDGGKTWALQTSGTTENLYGITGSGSGYVAVGGSGTIMTSSDGEYWATITAITYEGTEYNITDLGMGAISSVTYGNGSYLAVASQAVLTSTDGTAWTMSESGQQNCLYGVGYGNNLFVAVGDSGTILTSSAGAAWDSASSGTISYLYDVIHDGSRFIAAGNEVILTSDNGMDWNGHSIAGYYPNGVAYGKDNENQDLYVAVGSNGYPSGDQGIIITSTDRAAWSLVHTRTDGNTPLAAVAYGKNDDGIGLFVAVGRNNVTSGDYGVILTSSDGSSWSGQGDDSATWARLYGVAYGNGLFVAVGYNGIILTSPDGTTWTTRSSGVTYALKGVAYNNGQFTAVGSNGIILTSTDGTTWSGDTWASVGFKGVTYGDGAYVVVGESGKIVTLSAGDMYWTTRDSGTSNVLCAVSYANGVYVAVGADGTILTTATGSGSTVTPATADSTNNSVSVSPTSITIGSLTTITAAGDRQSVTGAVYGDERYIPTAWTSTEAGKNGTFTLSGSDYTSSYITSSAGSYTITATFQKQTWDGSAWNDAASTDTKTASLTVSTASSPTTANAANNSVSVNPTSITIGGSTAITAAGDRQSVTGSVYGDERYIPTVWTSTEAGKNGTFTLSGSSYTSSYTSLSAGSYTITATFQKQTWDGSAWNDASGAGAADTKSVNLTVSSPGGGGGGGGNSSSSTVSNPSTQQPAQTGVGNVTTQNGTATATVDSARLAQEIAKIGPNSVITMAITDLNADNVVFSLTVADLKAIADNKSMLQLETPYGIYKLPAAEIDFGKITKQYPNTDYKDIMVSVTFSRADGTKAKLDGARLVGQPVSIKVNLAAGSTNIELDEFTRYVERDLPVPGGSGFTTGVVIEEDGTLRPVPTKAVTINNKKYAAVFSRTNSVYCLINKPVSFADMSGHWAKDTVNDMASRLIINGVESNSFAPAQEITRAEFAAIVVRALGLKASGDAGFADVKSGDWYYGAVEAAYQYGIISGYGDGSFRPDNRITRQEAMVMVARAMKVAGLDTDITSEMVAAELTGFTDGGSFADWAKQGAAAVIRSGLVVGADGYVRPGSNITRAETAVIVKRLLEKAGLI